MVRVKKRKKIIIGYILTSMDITMEEELFLKLAKKKNIKIILINLFKKIDEKEFENQIRGCDLLYNSSPEDFVIEFLKTAEELGKTVIDTPQLYYYTEDKWMFYLKCRKHKVPTPATILLSHNLNIAKSELKEFGQWPVILKRIYGMMGEYVKKADNPAQAIRVMKKMHKKDCDKLPIIAQEFISSPSYRVTIIDKKIIQTAVKKNKGWKSTGMFSKKFEKFKIDSTLRKILEKIIRFTQIDICGVDLLKKNGKWLVLEVNSTPSLDFFDEEYEHLVDLVLTSLKKYHLLNKAKSKSKKAKTKKIKAKRTKK